MAEALLQYVLGSGAAAMKISDWRISKWSARLTNSNDNNYESSPLPWAWHDVVDGIAIDSDKSPGTIFPE